MSKKVIDLLSARLRRYKTPTDKHVLNSVKEILQELALLGLSRSGFFKKAAFHGGSAMRIFFGLDRFSEDLDFCLQRPDPDYSLHNVIPPLLNELQSWGVDVEVVERSKASQAVKKAFLKTSSLGAELNLSHPLHRAQKLVIKLEVDTNPPLGANCISSLCEFPLDFYVTTHDLQSMFSGKLHAILCRAYEKGRDWYDLMEYFSRRITPNYPFLQAALAQSGPFKSVTNFKELRKDWLVEQVDKKIGAVNVDNLRKEALPFIEDESRVALWDREYFRTKLERWAQAS